MHPYQEFFVPPLPYSPRNFLPHPFAGFSGAPLRRRLLLLFLPIPALVLGVLAVCTHGQLDGTLTRAVARNSCTQAHAMGCAISQVLIETRNQIAALAAGSSSLEELRHRLRRRTQAVIDIGDCRFREVAFCGTGRDSGERYLWITHKGRIVDLPPKSADAMSSSPFSIDIRPREHEVALGQPIEVVYSLNSSENNRPELVVTMKVVRFTTPVILTDGTFAGYLVVSVDLDVLGSTMAAFSMPVEKGPAPCALFVDSGGWMIFQMQLDGKAEPGDPESARADMRGTFGRAGFGPAFRPNDDRGYWQVINAIREGRSGQLFTDDTPWGEGEQTFDTVSYAPVTYDSGHGSGSSVKGGVVLLESGFAAMDQSSALRLAYAAAWLAAFLLMLVCVLLTARGLRRCLVRLRDDVAAAAEQSLSTALPERDEPQEIAEVRAGISEILRQKRLLEDERDMQDSMMTARVAQEPVSNMPQDVDYPEDGLIGVSREITLLHEDIQRAAKSQVDVLIMGETGTGKELISRAVHNLSDRSGGPFITINCGALDEGLLMDTLFGHVKGAYTEARSARKGAFLTAEGGTLMLDEVGTASPKVQTALLRALSERCIYPLGSDVKKPFNTRVIAATNADLQEEVARGNFREDLYFRLAVITIRTPPLRQRKMDIPYLIMAFMQQALKASGDLRREPGLSKGALSQLMHYHWPGNIRELRNVISRAMVFCEGDLIQPCHLRLGDQKADGEPAPAAEGAGPRGEREVAREPMQDPQREGAAASGPAETPSDAAPAPAGCSRQLSERLSRLLPLLRRAGEFSRKDYQDMAQVSMRTAQYDLQELLGAGVVERRGKARAQRYVFIDAADRSPDGGNGS